MDGVFLRGRTCHHGGPRKPDHWLSDTGRLSSATRARALARTVYLARSCPDWEEQADRVRAVLRGVWRASSLVECVKQRGADGSRREHRKITQGLPGLKAACFSVGADAADRLAPPGDREGREGIRADRGLPGEFRGVDGTSAAPPAGDQPPRRLRRGRRPVRLGQARRLGRRRGVDGGPVRARISRSRCDARQGGDGPPPPRVNISKSSRPARG